jgi:ketosteroid isomerase-like protein
MKKLFLGLVLIVNLYACNSDKSMKENDNQALVNNYFKHFNAHDWQKMAEMYADTANFKDPSLGIGVVKQTHQQTIKKYSELAGIFPDLRDDVMATYPSGENHIVVEFVSSGTGPDGVRFQLPICTIFNIKNGKIIQDFTYYDNSQE